MADQIHIKNKKARFEYEFIETFTAGMQLVGTEIKSIRASKASIAEAYCTVAGEEMWIRNMYVQEYENGGYVNHEPRRERKLLLRRTEINKISKQLKTKGLTVVPIRLFLSQNGLAKLEIALAQGKKIHDKRATMKDRDAKREMDRAMKRNA